VAKRLDYPIFMAVSERGGKNNSGDYEYVVDKAGSLVEYPDGHPQEGQLVVNQDLVNYDLRPSDLANAAKIPNEKLCVAEHFVRFAQEQRFNFWGDQ
jgi:type I restriction enzyme M protein